MAYQNVPVTDGHQVVQQLANFAAANGWTVHRNTTDNDDEVGDVPGDYDSTGVTNRWDGDYRLVTVSTPGFSGYVSLAGYQNEIYLNGHRGYDGSKKWFDQPDQYLLYDGDGNTYYSYRGGNTYNYDKINTRTRVELRVNPIQSVHFFGGMTPTPYLYAAIEMEPGFYRHMVIGHFQKFGTALGGLFWDVSSASPDSSSYVSFYESHRVPFLYNSSTRVRTGNGGFDCQDTTGAPRFAKFGNVTGSHLLGGHWSEEVRTFEVATPIQFNSRTALMTPLVWVISGSYRPFGTPPNFRYVNLTYFEAGDELTIGGDVWKLFPWARRKAGVRTTSIYIDGVRFYYDRPEDEATEMYGIAYLKD